MTLNPSNQRDWPWVLLLPGLAVYFHALSADALYKLFLYATPLGLGFSLYRLEPALRRAILPQLGWIVLFPVFLILIQLLSGAGIAAKESTQFLLYSAVAMVAVIGTARKTNPRQTLWYLYFAVFFIASYTAIQVFALYYQGRPYGTLKNPHYLAQYCLLLIVACLYFFQFFRERWIQLLIVITIALLGMMLIRTGSRPAWIALAFSSALYFWLQRNRFGWRALVLAACVVLGIYLMNAGGFRDRVDDLIMNVGQEERVTIWRDAVAMQKESSVRQWLAGHGVDRFQPDFMRYSEYGRQGINFNAPHNHLLEVLYTIGIAGLLAAAGLLLAIYYRLAKFYRSNNRSTLASMLITALTANLLFTSICISFFRSYSLLILALIGGLTIALHNHHESNHADHPQL